jgi:hypothetical protein
MNGPVYGVWTNGVLTAVGTRAQLRAKGVATSSDLTNGICVREVSRDDMSRWPNEWRDKAAAELRDTYGLSYEEIAKLLLITVGMAQGAVSRVRCGRYESE